jgi:hypothetical protein
MWSRGCRPASLSMVRGLPRRQQPVAWKPEDQVPDTGQLLTAVAALRSGTINDTQRQTVPELRDGILSLAQQAEMELTNSVSAC